jgi:hypothetical protein
MGNVATVDNDSIIILNKINNESKYYSKLQKINLLQNICEIYL